MRANDGAHSGMMVETENAVFAFMPTDQSSSNPAAGRNGQGARMTRRMDAIRNPKTMAGSQGADHPSASRNLAHGFCFSSRPSFENP